MVLVGSNVTSAALIVGLFIATVAIIGPRAPKILRVFGAIVLLNGLITPLVGVDRAQAILAWWVAQGPAIMRVWAAGAVALGVLVVYAVVPDRRAV